MATATSPPERQRPSGIPLVVNNVSEFVGLVATSPLFIGLSQLQCERVARQARPKVVSRDRTLYMQGQPAHSVALICSGTVKITQLSSGGNEVILWMYGAGNVIGLFPDPATMIHACSARAMGQCTVLVWEYRAFHNIMLEHSQIRTNFDQVLASRLHDLEERFHEMATANVAKRIALTLFRLSKQIGRRVEGGFEISLSREELAQMTGTTQFTASRILSKWGEMGLIQPRRQGILIRSDRMLEVAERQF
jgi:CRP-like cAMP-binding protein